MNYRSRVFFLSTRAKHECRGAETDVWRTRTRIVHARVFLGAGCCVSITPYSLHGVSHDNMPRDSDQGLRRSAGGGKQIYRTHKLRLIPASAIIYNPPYRITFQNIIYGDPNLYEVFFELCFCSSAHRARDRCQVRHCRRDCCMRKIRERTSHFSW